MCVRVRTPYVNLILDFMYHKYILTRNANVGDIYVANVGDIYIVNVGDIYVANVWDSYVANVGDIYVK